jgi:hypothetical protein
MLAGFDDPDQAYGALRLQLGPRGAAFAFENIAQTVLDEGAFACPGTDPDAAPPAAPGEITANATGPTRAELSWSPAVDDTVVTSYVIERDGTEIARADSMSTRYQDRALQPEGTYSYAVRAVDLVGNESEPATTTVTTPSLATVRPLSSAPASGSATPQEGPLDDGPPAWLLAIIAAAVISGGVLLLRPRRSVR